MCTNYIKLTFNSSRFSLVVYNFKIISRQFSLHPMLISLSSLSSFFTISKTLFFSDGFEFTKAKFFHCANESAATQLRGLSGVTSIHVRAGIRREVARGWSATPVVKYPRWQCPDATSDHTQHVQFTAHAQHAWQFAEYGWSD